MTLSDEVKQKIKDEFDAFKENMYAGKSREERKELEQFYTPPASVYLMLEKIKDDIKTELY